ncbi:DinB family protein [Bacillus sp. S/N-304-OC-R1]|uniref:DinB family protein n=1 Tax=Bacillus sp. S/N-304-OC-R1 TaxID=2758034 RepID=UPI001C8DA797|nr:DinB family protein [Bacillus sp. S/N-304-OC-R1]MBY0121365.1 DinB family protein [Bacillus sp. S/N-304-OC-R1]
MSLVKHFLSHRTVTNDLVAKIEEDNYGYKPTETSMSAQKLVTHMYTSYYQFVKTVKEGNSSPFLEKLDESEKSLIQIGEEYTEKTKDLLASLTEEELNREIDMTKVFGINVTGHFMVGMALEHEIHHKGNLFVYVREMGHTKLPLFINMK